MSQSPATIGRFRVIDRIGRGGMGSLYLAWDPVLERQIAIKLLREDMEELRERFDREARSVARLRHPNIVTIFDVGEQNGQPFIAMEYIHGQTLAEIIRSEPQLSVSRKLTIIDELCDGLGFAHRMAIIHRDVKPANVMVENEGGVKILDFGIARVAESGMTMAGMLIGTLNYMSPEQISGQVVDNRSDIFAIGAVMYELLSQRQAFPGGLQNGIIHRILNEPPAPLEAFCPTLDEEVTEIVRRALEKNAEARYQDLPAMRRDLQRVRQKVDTLANETVVATPDTSGETVVVERPEKKSSHPGRRATPKEALARLRATQLAAHLEAAQRALDGGDYSGAVSSAEHALLLDPEDLTAAEIIDRARAVLDELSVQDLVKRATELIDVGSLTEALGLCDQALTIAPGSPAAVALRDTLDRLRLERDRERQRVERARAATARAESCLATGNYEDAVAAAEEALQGSPDHDPARRVRQQALHELERTRKESRDQLAVRTAEDARRAFEAGEHDQALRILAAFEGEHSHVAQTLEALRGEKARLAREAERVRQEQVDAALARANAEPSHEAAIEHLRSALAVDPSRTDVSNLLADRQHALDIEREEARQARLREERIADGLTRAAEESHEAALAILEPLLPLGPEHPGLREAVEDRRSALGRQREAERLRLHQVDDAVARAKAEPSHEAAIEQLRRALAIDPSRTDVSKLLAERQQALDSEREKARQARLREERIADGIARAAAERSHEAAIGILEPLLSLGPDRQDLREALEARRTALDRQREEARRAEELRLRVNGLVKEAKNTPDHAAAIAVLRQALELDGHRSDVKQALQTREAELQRQQEEQRRAEERAALIAAAIRDAEGTDSDEQALRLLNAVLPQDPGHSRLKAAIERRHAALNRKQEEARKEQEKQARVAAAVGKATTAASHEAAIALLSAALDQDPGHPGLTRALEERREALERQKREELARREREDRERRERTTAAIARALSTPSHGEAVKILEQAAAQDPASATLRAALSERRAALVTEREQARRERERQEKVESAIREAKGAPHTEAALVVLRSALALVPDHEELRKIVAQTEARLAREREEARQLRERQAKVAALLNQVKATLSHERALELLREIIAIEPAHREAKELLQRREVSLEQERAAAKRQADIEATRRSIVQFIARGDFDRAETALKEADRALSAGKLLKAERAQLKEARRAAKRSASGPTSGLRPAVVAAIAASAAVILIVGYVAFGPSSSPESGGTTTPPPVAPGPSTAPSTAPPPTPTPAPPATTATGPTKSEPPVAPGLNPEPAPSTPATPTIDPGVADASNAARESLKRGDLQGAAAAVTRGLKIAPQSQELQGLARDIVNQARQATSDARTSATARGVASTSSPAFRDAQGRQADAGRRERANQHDRAVRSYLEAAKLYADAARVAPPTRPEPTPPPVDPNKPTVALPPPAAPVPSPPAPSTTGAAAEKPTASPEKPAPPAAATAAGTSSAGAPSTATPPAKPEPKPAPPTAAQEETAIRAALREYAAAYESLRVDAVQRIYPGVNAAALERSFRQTASQQVQISGDDQITIDGTTAVVQCQVRQTFTPKVGQRRTDVVTATFRLQKTGGRWLIMDRR